MSGRYFSLVHIAVSDHPADFNIGVIGVSEVFSRRGDIELYVKQDVTKNKTIKFFLQ